MSVGPKKNDGESGMKKASNKKKCKRYRVRQVELHSKNRARDQRALFMG